MAAMEVASVLWPLAESSLREDREADWLSNKQQTGL